MAGATFDQPMSYDPFSMGFIDTQRQPYNDFSPISLFNPLEDFSTTDFASDSAASPASPLSPVLSKPYTLPSGDDWTTWNDKIEQSSTEPAFLKTEEFESPTLTSIPQREMTPSLNPMDLASLTTDDVMLGREGINDSQPLFQSSPRSTAAASVPALSQPGSPVFAQLQSPVAAAVKISPVTSPEAEQAPKRPAMGGKRYPSRGLKRKSPSSSEDDENERSSASPPPPPAQRAKSDIGPKKTAHNMIEKRYRTNLNDKIAALRDSVPALRIMVHRLEQQDDDAVDGDEFGFGAGMGGRRRSSDEEDLGGLQPAHKLNKATILSKATEYIAHLERRNQILNRENSTLRGKVQGLEMIVIGGANGGLQQQVPQMQVPRVWS